MKREEPRIGRVGEFEFQFWECWESDAHNPQAPERHWFRALNGIEASTSDELLRRLTGKFVPTSTPPEQLSAVSSQLSATTEGSVAEPVFTVSHDGNLVAASSNAGIAISPVANNFDAAPDRTHKNRRYTRGNPRWIRVGDTDVQVMEYRHYNSYWEDPMDQWFESPNGIVTDTYQEMLQKLGGRPKPLLPEDEHRPASATSGVDPAIENASVPETGMFGIIEDAFEAASRGSEGYDCQSDDEGRRNRTACGSDGQAFADSHGPETEAPQGRRGQRPKVLGAYPWTLDEREPEEISDIELHMQTIWVAEMLRDSDPDLYEAALDSVKREAYLKKFVEEELITEEEQLAADSAPRCQFIRANGSACGSPALKRRRFCHFHDRTDNVRKKSHEIQLPVLEDDLAIQMAVTNICRGLLKGRLEPKCASTLLYGLQVASVAVRKQNAARSRAKSDPQDVAY